MKMVRTQKSTAPVYNGKLIVLGDIQSPIRGMILSLNEDLSNLEEVLNAVAERAYNEGKSDATK